MLILINRINQGVIMLSRDIVFHMTSVPLADWIEKNEEQSTSIWDGRWSVVVQRGDKHGMEEALSSFCYSILDLEETEQVFVARTVFVSIITDLLRTQGKKRALRPEILQEAYQMIYKIECWENISEFILGIQGFIDTIVDKILFYSPFFETCPHLDRAIRIINQHITNRDLSVSFLAEHLNLSTTHLSNLFRLNLGMNASDYIAKRKIAEITYDIVHTSLPLADIREKYGFISHSHFIQFFKRHQGKTPLKYRQHVTSIVGDNE